MILPKTTSLCPAVPEIILTTSSGAEVPSATIVSPMANSEMLNFLASDEAPLTNAPAPLISSTKPMITSVKYKSSANC